MQKSMLSSMGFLRAAIPDHPSCDLCGNRRKGNCLNSLQVKLLRSMVDVNPDHVSRVIKVQNKPIQNFARVRTGPGIQVAGGAHIAAFAMCAGKN